MSQYAASLCSFVIFYCTSSLVSLVKVSMFSDFYGQPDSFYFNVLLFAEDVREFQFPSFSNFPVSWQPNEQQQEAADNLVKMLDLAPSGKVEILQPELTPNPALEVLNICGYFGFLDV